MSIQQMLLGAGAAADPIDPRDHFDVKLYTGNNATNTQTGLGFSPDLVWIKNRTDTANSRQFDTVRGATEAIYSDASDAETTESTALTAFTSDGFTVSTENAVNGSGDAIVAWCWNAGSSTVSNTAGDITTTVRANPAAGFSIVKLTVPSSPSSGMVAYGHGLGAEPSLVISKRTDSTNNWMVFTDLTGSNQYLNLNSTAGITSTGSYFAKSDSTFSLQNGHYTDSGWDIINYCFAPVEGYSKFGTYTGTYPVTSGHSITCGFEPTFLMIKRLDNGTSGSAYGGWMMMDNARTGSDDQIFANCAEAEGGRGNCSSTGDVRGTISFTSTGFDVSGGYYEQNDTCDYLYAAFA